MIQTEFDEDVFLVYFHVYRGHLLGSWIALMRCGHFCDYLHPSNKCCACLSYVSPCGICDGDWEQYQQGKWQVSGPNP